jgi:hypothetical protein
MKVRMVLVLMGATILAQGLVLRTSADAASRLTEDFSDLVKRAAVVVEVKIERCRQEQNEQVGMPLTVASAQVVRVHRGTMGANAQLEMEKFGGEVDGMKIVVPGQVEFVEGAHAFALLVESPLNNGRWRVLGGDAGYVLREKSGQQTVARRATGRFDYFVSDEKSLTGFVSRQSQSMNDEDFNALVAALLETGRPVINVVSHEATATPIPAQPSLPVVAMPIASAAGESSESSLLVRLGAVLLFITLAWGAGRLTRAVAR